MTIGKLASSLTLTTLAFLTSANSVYADGMFIDFEPTNDRWNIINETDQQAYINYENGIQKMLLGINLAQNPTGNSAWIFPIPAKPASIEIDITSDLPKMDGTDVLFKAKNNVDNVHYKTIGSIFPILLAHSSLTKSSITIGAALWPEPNYYSDEKVVVYEHLEKAGLTTEIVSARNPKDIIDYLARVGVKIDGKAAEAITKYNAKDYAFIISSTTKFNPQGQNKTKKASRLVEQRLMDNFEINLSYYMRNIRLFPNLQPIVDKIAVRFADVDLYSSSFYYNYKKDLRAAQAYLALYMEVERDPLVLMYADQTLEDLESAYAAGTIGHIRPKKDTVKDVRAKAIYVSFPTKKIFFPLYLTSVYNDLTIPITVRVFGHVSPKIYSGIRSEANVRYITDGTYTSTNTKLYTGPIKDIDYTKVLIRSQSKNFTDDLWISPRTPLKIVFADFINHYTRIYTFLILILLSVAAAITAGYVVDSHNKKNFYKYALIGAANVFTIFGVILATVFTKFSQNTGENLDELIKELDSKGYKESRAKTLKLFRIMTIWTPLLYIIVSILVVVFAVTRSRHNIDLPMSIRVSDIYNFVFGTFLIVENALLIMFLIKDIVKKEDRAAFKLLAQNGYSTYTFKPKRPNKLAFLFLFPIILILYSAIFSGAAKAFIGKSENLTINDTPGRKSINI